MAWFSLKSARNRAIAIQLAIVAGLILFYTLALPGIRKAREEAASKDREQRIVAFAQSVAVETAGPNSRSRNVFASHHR